MRREDVEQRAMALLSSGDVQQAGELIARFEANQPHPRGLGNNWEDGMDAASVESARSLLSQDFSELGLSRQDLRNVAVSLALSAMLGESIDQAAGRLREQLSGTIDNDTFSTRLRLLGERQYGLEPDSPDNAASMFASYWLMWALHHGALDQIRSLPGTGVEILPGRDASCATGRLRFSHEEVDSVPALPHRWGCGCTYVGLVSDDDA